LRIAVNREFESLERALEASVARLKPGGRLVVIAFHSLEDRIVKQFIARESATCVCPPEQAICTCDTTPRLRRLGSSRRPSAREQADNPRSRSAVMRVAERTAAG
jgi:16S rRNA (cytosine1402-N4)-methyltransferase